MIDPIGSQPVPGGVVGRVPQQRAPESDLLGDVLVERGLLAASDLAWALDVQKRTGSRLGAILIASGLVRRLDLYRTLAQVWDSEFVDVAHTVIDPELVAGLEPRTLVDEGWIPVRRDPDGVLVVATAEEPSAARCGHIEQRVGSPSG